MALQDVWQEDYNWHYALGLLLDEDLDESDEEDSWSDEWGEWDNEWHDYNNYWINE